MSVKWRCPYCNTFSAFLETPKNNIHAWVEIDCDKEYGPEFGEMVKFGASTQIRECSNPECGEISVFSRVCEMCYYPVGGINDYELDYQDWIQIHPRPTKTLYQLPDYIPAGIREDFTEAMLVKDVSPKASVALCRRCVQAMIRDYWKISKGTLSKEIEELDKSGQAPSSIEALDAIREMGNFGAHPERDASLIIDVEPKDAELSIQIVDSLIKDWYVHSHDHEERQARLRESIDSKFRKRLIE